MRRAFWSVPVALVAWYVLGFGVWYLDTDERRLLPLSAGAVDVLVVGGLVGGIAAGMVVRRLQIAVPLVLLAGGGLWWIARPTAAPSEYELRGLLITLLVATGLGGVMGAIGSHRSVLAAIALSAPVASYITVPGPLWDGDLAGEVSGLLVAVGLSMLLYVACWHNGWRALTWWPVVAGAYLASFALVSALARVATSFRPGVHADPDVVADAAMDTFIGAFRPFLETYWGWLGVAVLVAVMIVALKIRVLPPAPPTARPVLVDDGSNDAFLPDDLGWFDHAEPRRLIDRLPHRREPVG